MSGQWLGDFVMSGMADKSRELRALRFYSGGRDTPRRTSCKDAPARTVEQPSKNTDSTFFIQVAAAASMASQLVYRSSVYSTFMPTLVTVRFGPSNGGQTTVWISVPLLTTTMRRFINPPVLGRRSIVPVQLALT